MPCMGPPEALALQSLQRQLEQPCRCVAHTAGCPVVGATPEHAFTAAMSGSQSGLGDGKE